MRNKKDITKILLIIAIILVLIGIIVVGVGIFKKYVIKRQNPVATIEVDGYGTIKVELYPEKAPNTVSNFIALANRGFYDGLTFHRVIEDFMIQGGDKAGDGTGSPTIDDLKGNGDTSAYCIKGEMIANGFNKNTLKLKRGVIAMGRGNYSEIIDPSLTEETYNSAGSQFFIMQKDYESIDGLYAGFGKVIEGMDIVDQIAKLEVTYKSADYTEGQEIPKDSDGKELTADMPLNKPVIKSITIDTFGIDYGEPETLEPFNYFNYLMQKYASQQQQQ